MIAYAEQVLLDCFLAILLVGGIHESLYALSDTLESIIRLRPPGSFTTTSVCAALRRASVFVQFSKALLVAVMLSFLQSRFVEDIAQD